MALLNQGFVRSLNLFEIEDSIKALQNLGDASSVPSDLLVFAGNKLNNTELQFRAALSGTINLFENELDLDAGTIFTQTDKIATFGNGDKVRLKVAKAIETIERNATNDSLLIKYVGGHEIPESRYQTGQPPVLISLEGTFFSIAGTALNQKFYISEYVTTTQLRLLNVGYPEQLELVNGSIQDVNDPGTFDLPDLADPARSYYPYSTSQDFPYPQVENNGDPERQPIAFDRDYYIVFSDAITKFRLGYNFSRRELIKQVRFADLSDFTVKDFIIVRSNETFIENLENLARPVFEDQNFSYSNSVLNRNFNSNFSTLETYLDSANFFRQKKYLTTKNNYYNVPEIGVEGVYTTSDPDIYNSIFSDLGTSLSPGVYILNRDATNLATTPPVINRLRAYSDNTQPWSIVDNPDPTPDTLEYQVLRDPITELPRDAANQAMDIGNFVLGDTNNGVIEICTGVDNGEYFQGVQILAGSEKQLDLSAYGISNSQVYAVDQNNYRFTHKIDCLIEGEFYSLCLTKDIGTDDGTGVGSDPSV